MTIGTPALQMTTLSHHVITDRSLASVATAVRLQTLLLRRCWGLLELGVQRVVADTVTRDAGLGSDPYAAVERLQWKACTIAQFLLLT